jgi:membrane protease YdiL (CAAX protease family)
VTDSKKSLFLFLIFYSGFFFVAGVFRLIFLCCIVAVSGKACFDNIKKLECMQCVAVGMITYFVSKSIVSLLSLPGGYNADSFIFSPIFFIDVLLLTPLAEELVFRKCLADCFNQKSMRFFIPISMFLFASVHFYQGIGGVVFTMLCALVLSFTYKMKKKIIFSVIMHIFINLGGCLDCIFFN